MHIQLTLFTIYCIFVKLTPYFLEVPVQHIISQQHVHFILVLTE